MVSLVEEASVITLDVLGIERVLVETNAPARYDYAGLTLVGDRSPEKDGTRLVLVPRHVLDAQLQRYGSGLYVSTVVEDPFVSVEYIREQLLALAKQLGGESLVEQLALQLQREFGFGITKSGVDFFLQDHFTPEKCRVLAMNLLARLGL